MASVFSADLDIEQLNAIFRNSLAREASKSITAVVLYPQNKGFQQDSTPIYFDKSLVDRNKQIIEYFMGQLKDVHDGKMLITMESAKLRYDEPWTTNSNAVMALLHLALAAGLIEPFVKGVGAKLTRPIIPTLHTRDSNFGPWIRENEPKLLKAYFGE